MFQATQTQIIDFLLKPALYETPDNSYGYDTGKASLYYSKFPQNRFMQTNFYHLSTAASAAAAKRYAKSMLMQKAVSSGSSRRNSYGRRGDYGRTARLSLQMNRLAELCVF
ncbi:unnamed protein product [Enterobius vermicularis]|uniref:Serine-type D-Ala-D-Ala carboxypeptidase n=1 Tax=Enterobius vermicularis TaxID=51028 RepID=A0A0N4VL43_ENTVE|nr:unnamed protein product [Enterobius vermicularis]